MGTDYLDSPYDPRDDNYFNSGILPLAVELGALNLGGSFLQKYGNKKLAKATPRLFGASPSKIAGRTINKVSASTVSSQQLGRDALKLGKTFSKYSKIYGFASMAVMGFQLTKGAVGASRSLVTGVRDIEESRRSPAYVGNDEYFDSRVAFTQRQRALQVIHNSQMSTRAAFGSESSFLHY